MPLPVTEAQNEEGSLGTFNLAKHSQAKQSKLLQLLNVVKAQI